jgi:hypothetical protein
MPIRSGFISNESALRFYSRNSIGVWFRVFRTMTRDAMVALELPGDPTLRE